MLPGYVARHADLGIYDLSSGHALFRMPKHVAVMLDSIDLHPSASDVRARTWCGV
jgi:hypothetical protein